MQSYNILAIDPATSTGYCICKITKEKEGIIVEYGIIEVDTASAYQGDHCIDLMNKFKKIITDKDIKKIAIEDYYFSRKCASGSNVNVAFRTAIHILARSMNLEYKVIGISNWKKHIAGRSIPTAAQKKKWKNAANKYFIQQAVFDKWGIKFPNHLINGNGKCVLFKSDIVDAVAICIFYAETELNVKKITSTVNIAENINEKKYNKMFMY